MAELRSFIFLNRLQPQTMCYLGTWIRGSLPRSDVAAQIIEVAPGLDIEPVTDVALKHAGVRAGILVVERQFGYLEIHGGNDEVRAAGSAVLDALGVSARDATRPAVLASKIISMLDPQHAFLINRNKIGSMALAGESLFVLEMQPRAGDAAGLVRDPGGQRGGEGGQDQGGRLPDDRGHRAGVPVRIRGGCAPSRRGRRGCTAEQDMTSEPGMTGPRSAEPAAVDTEAIRALVREVLADLLPAAGRVPGNPGGAGGTGVPGAGVAGGLATAGAGPAQPGLPHTVREDVESVEVVSIRTDADLGNFVLHLLHLFENPKHRDALRAGRLRFRLAAAAVPGSAQPSHRDRARAAGVEIVKER